MEPSHSKLVHMFAFCFYTNEPGSFREVGRRCELCCLDDRHGRWEVKSGNRRAGCGSDSSPLFEKRPRFCR